MTRLSIWDPFNQLNDLQRQVSQMFDDNVHRVPSVSSVPPINISETDTEVIVEMAVPGFQEEDIDIQVARDTITISGEAKVESEEKDKKTNVLRQEIRKSSFSRTVALPTDVDPEKAEANFDNGILHVSVVKAKETMKRKIPITAKKQ
jgi:HSP20 family protein